MRFPPFRLPSPSGFRYVPRMQDRPIDLVIYDCDGTLIDSEIIAWSVESDSLARLGVTVSAAELVRDYAGLSHPEIIRRLRQDFDIDLPDDHMTGIREETTRRLAQEAVALPGVEAVLAEIRVPVCMATSAHPMKLDAELRKTGLLDHFAPHIFRADMVARSKPAPDLFLYAAKMMATAPEHCLVVEDSVHGIEAARAAGMFTLGYDGGSHCPPGHSQALEAAGAHRVMRHHLEILDFL